MSNEDKTDYQPGDGPVSVGAVVEYRDREFEVSEHQAPSADLSDAERTENYPDGVAYVLWPVGVPEKFGNRGQSVVRVRRRSFRVKSAPHSDE